MASVNELDSSHNNNLRETLVSAAKAKLKVKVKAVNLHTLLRMWPLNSVIQMFSHASGVLLAFLIS